jgi:hypothetical protein
LHVAVPDKVDHEPRTHLVRIGFENLIRKLLSFVKVGAVGLIKSGGDIGAAIERERFRKALALMREPRVAARVCVPVARRSLDALQRRQKAEILGQPAVEEAPLS